MSTYNLRLKFNIYVSLRFGLVNIIDSYLRLKKWLNAHILNSPYKIGVWFVFEYKKNLKLAFQPVFEYKITVWICEMVFWVIM